MWKRSWTVSGRGARGNGRAYGKDVDGLRGGGRTCESPRRKRRRSLFLLTLRVYDPESKLITSLRARLEAQRRQDQLVQEEIRTARKVLVKEVVDVFGVRPCRPLNVNGVDNVDGCRVGKGDGMDFGREEWDMEIAGLTFPSPGGFTGNCVLLSPLPVSTNNRLTTYSENSTYPVPRYLTC
jgi:hypothetical protein